MNYRNLTTRVAPAVCLLIALVVLAIPYSLHAQRGGQAPAATAGQAPEAGANPAAQRGGGGGGRGGGGGGRGGRGGGAAQTGQAAAPIDLTGYWVALVTEDWRWRMVTPKKGDFPSIPLNPAGRDSSNAWDPAKDEANGDQCKSYGAGNVMRLPARFHISWADPNTLKVEVDNGTQTRLFHFGAGQAPPETKPNPADPKNWQGNSVASWETAGGRGARGGELKVVTTGARPGYLQKNGVPYSANAVFTEHFNRYDEDGWSLMVVSTLTEDPTYLQQPHIRSSHYKKLADGTGWNPTPCTAK